MLRVKDPKRSLDYYKLLGLSQVNKFEFPDNKFDLYFLGMVSGPAMKLELLFWEPEHFLLSDSDPHLGLSRTCKTDKPHSIRRA